MVSLDFITKNPALDEFNRQQKEQREQQLADARSALMTGQTERIYQQNDFDQQASPSRLRSIDAGATNAETEARVGAGTADTRIARPAAELADFEGEAGVRRETAPNRIAKSGADLDVDRARARKENTEANVGEQTAPTRVEAAKTGLRKANAEATNSELQGFYKSLDLLEHGDVAGAKAAAKASGQELTDEHINDTELRRSLTSAAKRAQELYPNRPKDQQAFIQGRIDDMNDRRSRGLPVNTPTDNYSLPTGAPTPPEQSGTQHNYEIINRSETDENGKPVVKSYKIDKRDGSISPVEGEGGFSRATGAGASSRTSVFQQKQQAWLAAHPDDTQGALDYANNKRNMTEVDIQKSALSQATREAAGDQMLRFNGAKRQAFIATRTNEISDMLRKANTPAAPTLPGRAVPPPGPAQQRPDMMTPGDGGRPITSVMPPGGGSREQPYQATTQEHIEWFKQNAPADAVIVVNGQPYTK